MQNFRPEIKNIIFDLGGVLLNIDYQKSIQAFIHLGFNDFASSYSQARQSELFDLFETGKINEEGFFHSLNSLFNSNVPPANMLHAWNAMLLDLPEHRIHFLQSIRSKYRIFLLSNTNQSHQNAFEKIIENNNGIKRLEDLFEKVYYSHQIGMRKPHAEVFEHVLHKNLLQASDTLFIDDSAQHVEGAKSVGLHAIWLGKNQDVTELLSAFH